MAIHCGHYVFFSSIPCLSVVSLCDPMPDNSYAFRASPHLGSFESLHVRSPPGQSAALLPCRRSVKTTDFYATLMFGVFMTLAGIFGLVAESLGSAGSRWWFSAAYAMQTLAILIGEIIYTP
jgi:hypothetical protein